MDITLTFGKYNGKKLSEVPRGYVQWLAENSFNASVRHAAKDFLREQPASQAIPDAVPRTYQEATKLEWKAHHGYGNAQATLIAARDENGFLVVWEEEEQAYMLLSISPSGMLVNDALSSMPLEKLKKITETYPVLRGSYYLEHAIADKEEQQEKSLSFVLSNGDVIDLEVEDNAHVAVSINGLPTGIYELRDLNEHERNNPQYQVVAAILVPDTRFDTNGARKIGLTPERKALVEAKIQEVSNK